MKRSKKSTANQLMTQFDKELKSILMNDLKLKGARK